MEVQYKHNLKSNYIVLKNADMLANDFRVNMLLKNQIEGFLPFCISCVDGNIELSYLISSKQSIRQIVERKKLRYHALHNILNGIINIAVQSHEYLLKTDDVLLDSEFIFTDYDCNEIWVCYYPNYAKSFQMQIRDLIHELLLVTDHEDKKAVEFIYEMFEICGKDNFLIKDIEQYLDKQSLDAENPYKREIKQRDNIDRSVEFEEYKKGYEEEESELWERQERECLEKKGIKEIFGNLLGKSKQGRWLKGILEKGFNNRSYKPYKDYEDGACIGFEEYEECGNSIKNEKSIKSENSKENENYWMYPKSEDYGNGYNYERDEMNIPSICAEDNNTILISDLLADTRRILFSMSEQKNIELETYPFVIGKLEEQTDYVIKSKLISRIHMRIEKDSQNHFYVEDMNSKNGTFINGVRLEPYEKKEIEIGDRIAIASFEYIFR